MSGERLRCLLHLMGLAATLSAAKVILSTAGVALFLAKEGPERLPVFYIVLALVAVLMSAGFAGVVDRLPKIRLAQTAFLATLLGAAALRVPIALDAPGVYHALLASAHVYEIVTDIVFWLVVAAYLDTLEVRRGTSFLYMAVAAGGVAGGVFTSALALALPAEDMLLALPVLGGAMVAQFALAERTCGGPREPDGGGEEEEAAAGIARNLLLLARIVGRYPLALLIALNALVLTVLYGLTEYLVFTLYAARFPDEGELTRFLAVVFALIQVLEFVLLYAVSRPLLGRTGPLVRNLVFPVGSLLSLVALASGARLPAAVGAHLNAEAVSNAVFQPVNNTNYGALPLRFQGRVRTLADGIFYPSGLALAGVMLLSLQGQTAPLQVNLIAIVFALLFAALNVGVGVLFLPTLVRNLRSGVVHFEDVAGGTEALPAAFAERVRGLLRSDDPDDRAIGLGLAGRLDPAPILDELRALATRADRAATRRAIVGVLARARPKEVERLLDDLLDGSDERGQLVALQAKLARREEIAARHIRRLARSTDRSVAALAALAAIPPGAARGARPESRSADGELPPPGPRD
ncbi:MAG TPA: hypothetical protein VFG47_07145, partial [Geminicoccaceae bacterium]|nr:hypothetical protein [Geminicoccaceae bacterium]